jgi:hypothetical protein
MSERNLLVSAGSVPAGNAPAGGAPAGGAPAPNTSRAHNCKGIRRKRGTAVSVWRWEPTSL